MADFKKSFDYILSLEGWDLTNTPHDRGGQTYAGVARKMHPGWEGWAYVDRGDALPELVVEAFYHDEFWRKIKGDEIADQRVASALLASAVNIGPVTAAKLAQRVLEIKDDGIIGKATIFALNGANVDLFLARFALVNIARHTEIAAKDKSQRGFLVGWNRRDMKGAAL